MADSKISALLASTTPLAGTEVLPIVQSSATKQVSIANLTAGRAVSAASLALTTSPLPATSGGTGASSAFTSSGVVYASSTSVLATGGALTFDGSQLVVDSLGTQLKLTRTSAGSGTLNIGGSGEIAYAAALHIFYNAAKSTEFARIETTGAVGIGASSLSASAILEVQSTTKGVRMPNMTTTQKNAISSPVAGLMVFDTTLAKLCVYSGSAWQTVTSI